jgi:uncharacterized protein YjbI with pentapeptide repeats
MKPLILCLALAITLTHVPDAFAQTQSCQAPTVPSCPAATGKDYSNQNLTDQNFSRKDLTGANFTNAILNGAQFVGTTLKNAVFSGASLAPSAKQNVNFTAADLTGACFQNTKLTRANLQFANVTCTDFSNADLTNAVFALLPKIVPAAAPGQPQPCRTKFVKATMKIDQFPTRLWGYTDFTNTNFVDLTPGSFSLHGVDITGAMLGGVKMAGFDLTNSILTSVDLSCADLRGAHLDNATAYGLSLNHANAAFATAEKIVLFNAATPTLVSDLRNLLAQKADFSGGSNMTSANLRNANFGGARLANANLTNAILEAGEGLNSAQLTAADLSNTTFSGAHLNAVSFQNTRLTNATFYGTTLSNTDLSNAVMPGASFQQSTLQGVTFQGSAIQNVSFKNATLSASPSTGSGVNFNCALLGGVDFTNTTINAASFNAAVLPPYTSCCSQVGGTFFCGIEPASQSPYGPTVLPVLQAQVTCPNGDIASCSATEWVIPNWQTTLCNSQGATQQVWVPPDCHLPPPAGTVVNIPDPNFKKCLHDQFFGPTAPPKDITKVFAATVQEINCSARGITDSTGLEAFTGLAQLDLTANQLTDGAVYANLVNLQVLKVPNNKLPLLNLSGLNNLTYVDASNNQINQVNGFVSTYLQYLDLSNNQLSGSFPLTIQSSLFFADLSHNSLTGIGTGDLSGFTSMAYLYLENNKLTTIGSLKTIADAGTLQHINLGCNLGFNCASLQLSSTGPEGVLLAASNCGVQLPSCQTQMTRPGPRKAKP